jgi:hypothetical protein
MRIDGISNQGGFGQLPPHGPLSPNEMMQVKNLQSNMVSLVSTIKNSQDLPSDERISVIRNAQIQLISMQGTMNDLLAENKNAFFQAAPDCISDLGYIQRDLNTLIANPNNSGVTAADMNAVASRLQHFINGGDY